ncbi:hypothetical protein PPACK8108_LOCUS4621 [Phakopsora pachyrhizi]|uniref:DUF4817 domain-containing protein n=1 Tax=Phakopsora pachyrhizi TaxID=170000 RepID=A0AAV0AQK8_PHAPC|nr:hypothetical protein PPACK8108_LOCUS4621 [Phakopsora pachyrhizi]
MKAAGSTKGKREEMEMEKGEFVHDPWVGAPGQSQSPRSDFTEQTNKRKRISENVGEELYPETERESQDNLSNSLDPNLERASLDPINNDRSFSIDDIDIPVYPSSITATCPNSALSIQSSAEKEKRRNHSSTYQTKLEILNWYHANGKNQSRTAQFFSKKYPDLNIKQPLISSWLKFEDQIRFKARLNHDKGISKPGGRDGEVRRMRERLYPKINQLLKEWLHHLLLIKPESFRLTDEHIKSRWKAFADLDQIPRNDFPKHPPEASRLTVVTITNASAQIHRLIFIGTSPNLNLPSQNEGNNYDNKNFDYYYNLTGSLTGLIFYQILNRLNQLISIEQPSRESPIIILIGCNDFFPTLEMVRADLKRLKDLGLFGSDEIIFLSDQASSLEEDLVICSIKRPRLDDSMLDSIQPSPSKSKRISTGEKQRRFSPNAIPHERTKRKKG